LVTVRDFTNKVLAGGMSPETAVGAVMTRDPVTLPPSALGSDVLHIMLERRIGHLPVVENGALVIHKRGFWAGGRLPGADGFVEVVRMQPVVGIQKNQGIACCMLEDEIPHGDEALMGTRHETDPVPVSFRDGHRIVVGSIVHHQDFVNGMGLGQRAVDGFAEKTSVVVAGDRDGDGQSHGWVTRQDVRGVRGRARSLRRCFCAPARFRE
jgi:CBS domain-containing protein